MIGVRRDAINDSSNTQEIAMKLQGHIAGKNIQRLSFTSNTNWFDSWYKLKNIVD